MYIFTPLAGQPRPQIEWWQDEALVDSVSEDMNEQITRNHFKLPRLRREDLLRNFSCVARNNNMTEPLSKVVTVDIACQYCFSVCIAFQLV